IVELAVVSTRCVEAGLLKISSPKSNGAFVDTLLDSPSPLNTMLLSGKLIFRLRTRSKTTMTNEMTQLTRKKQTKSLSLY
mgnify:CR=1